MGVSAACHRFLLQANQRQGFAGSLVTLGRQEIWITSDEFDYTAQQLGSNLQACATTQHERLTQGQASKHFMDDRSYFKSLGFKDYKSLDADPYENADIIFDLGNSELPQELTETTDVVLDIGVIEHCFNIPAALKNIFMLLRTGGRAILFNPTIQQIDASFYFFQPTLFFDYFRANGWRIDRICIYAFPQGKWHNDECNTIIEYEPGLFDLNAYGLDGRRYGVHTVATKLAQSTWNQIPNQRRYKEVWQMTQIMPELNRILQDNHLAVAKIAATVDFDKLVEIVRTRLTQDALDGKPITQAKEKLRQIVQMFLGSHS